MFNCGIISIGVLTANHYVVPRELLQLGEYKNEPTLNAYIQLLSLQFWCEFFNGVHTIVPLL